MVMKCSAIAKSGSRCQTAAVAGSSFCYLHAPEMAERRREAAVKDGHNRSAKARAATQIPEAMTAEARSPGLRASSRTETVNAAQKCGPGLCLVEDAQGAQLAPLDLTQRDQRAL